MITRPDTNTYEPIAIVSSRRFQAGVEIVEREEHFRSGTPLAIVPSASLGSPRLVIEDAISSATKFLISKTRNEVEGLDSILNMLALRP